MLWLNKLGRIFSSHSSAVNSVWNWNPKMFSVNITISCLQVLELAKLSAFGGSSSTHSLCDSKTFIGPFSNNCDVTELSFVAVTFSVRKMNFPEGFLLTTPPKALAMSWWPKQMPTKREVGFADNETTKFSACLIQSLSSLTEWWLPEKTKPLNLARSSSEGSSPAQTSNQRHSVSSHSKIEVSW